MPLDRLYKVIFLLIILLSQSYAISDGIGDFKKDGPIVVCSDTLDYQSADRKIIYSGKVFLLQLKNKDIYCTLNSTESENNSKSASYFDRGENKDFQTIQNEWMLQAKKICIEEKGCNFISGQKLTINLDDDRKVDTIVVDSIGSNFVKFYFHPQGYVDLNAGEEHRKLSKGPTEGESRQVVYDVVDKTVSLIKDAVSKQNGNEYKGEKIDYDLSKDLIYVPGDRRKRSRFVLDGIAEDAKINTGLTKIKELQKNDDSTQQKAMNKMVF